MADKTRQERSEVVSALIGAPDREQYIPAPRYTSGELSKLSQRLLDQNNSENAAREVIYASVANWSGHDINRGDKLPIVREDKIVHWIGSPYASLDPIEDIIGAARLKPRSALMAEQKQLSRLIKVLEEAQRIFYAVEVENSWHLDRTWTAGARTLGTNVDIVHALGLASALSISVHGIIHNIRQRLREVDRELESHSHGPGRPENKPAHEVTKKFVLLYVAVTGRRPSCSTSDGMFFGDFSPMLRDLFDALGWVKTKVEGPAEKAIAAIPDDYANRFEPEKTGHLGGFFGLKQ
ncbi:hypothetical protein [Paracoccus saliphilus]|uniref:Uncharacterized protein n=1 Tax=Paracoccus saliphilus TaxID=405559 RepID=A0AA45W1Q5_9RHOB|nr:hypothetical protein [Paracoccus saliphilus]WCR03756.1 hypothetical protein JHX88_03020 [Paracoccus saliphilus]SIS59088.1 hypothetical protein SAMN05421772_101681 [Paracoccus saliphilus]